MAVHQDLTGMAIDAIDEHLAIAEYCVNTLKPGSGNCVYGYTAVLILFSVVDALSNFLGYPENSLGALKEFSASLSDSQIRSLKDWFRNPATHRAMIAPETKLTLEEGHPFAFEGFEPSHIRVRPFYRLVKDQWDLFDRKKIAATFHDRKVPQSPINLAGASSAARSQ